MSNERRISEIEQELARPSEEGPAWDESRKRLQHELDVLRQRFEPAAQPTDAQMRQNEYAAFNAWWEASGQGTEPLHTLTTKNCAHAAWQARAAMTGKAQEAAHKSAPIQKRDKPKRVEGEQR